MSDTAETQDGIATSVEPIRRFEFAGAIQGTLNKWLSPDFPYELSDQQMDAITAIGHSVLDGIDSGYVQMATSTGKTVVEAFLTEAAVRAGQRALVLAPTKVIARQISGRDGESGIGQFTDLHQQRKVREHFDTRRGSVRSPVVVSTYHGFLNDYRRNYEQLGRFGVVIGDECHRSLGINTSDAMLKAYPGAFKFGLSATPDFAIDRRSDEVYGDEIYRFSLTDAIEKGQTNPVRPLIYETDQTIQLIDNREEFTERELRPLIKNMARNSAAINMAREFVESGRQGIIRCVPGDSNIHAQILARLLSEYKTESGRYILALDVGAHLSNDENKQRLKAFDKGNIDVLLFTKALDEGWDSKAKPRFCINLAKSVSSVVTTQLLGRIMRRGDDGLDSVFVDFIDKTTGFAKGQFTALHALGFMDVDVNRVLGHRQLVRGQQAPYRQRPLDFSPALLAQLSRSQGKLLKDMERARPAEVVDPVARKWEGILARAGMPAEFTEYNLAFDRRFAERLTKARREFLYEHGREGSDQEIYESMTELTEYRKDFLKKYGARVPFDEIDEDSADLTMPDDPTYESAIGGLVAAGIDKALEDFSERDASIMRDWHGLSRYGRTVAELSDFWGISKNRVQQIVQNGETKLRNYCIKNGVLDLLEPGEVAHKAQMKDDTFHEKLHELQFRFMNMRANSTPQNEMKQLAQMSGYLVSWDRHAKKSAVHATRLRVLYNFLDIDSKDYYHRDAVKYSFERFIILRDEAYGNKEYKKYDRYSQMCDILQNLINAYARTDIWEDIE